MAIIIIENGKLVSALHAQAFITISTKSSACIRDLLIDWRYSMKGYMNTDIGEIYIDNEVLAQYAGASAVECFGVVGMASVNMKDGIVKLLKRDNLSHGVNVTIENNKITIDLHIIVSYGVSISAVADNLISNVKYNVEEFSGIEVKKINIFVEGVRVID